MNTSFKFISLFFLPFGLEAKLFWGKTLFFLEGEEDLNLLFF